MNIVLRGLLFLLFSIAGLSAIAQTDRHYTPVRKALINGADRILIQSESDIDLLSKHFRKLYGAVGIRVNGRVNIIRLADVVVRYDELLEIDLVDWDGELTREVCDRFWQVEEFRIFLSHKRVDAMKQQPVFDKFSAVTLHFESGPDTHEREDYFSLIRSLKNCRRAWIVGPFRAPDVQEIVKILADMPHITQLGLSLDKFSDLPAATRKLPGLRELTLIDNLSWMANKGWEDLMAERYSLNFQDDSARKRSLNLVYLSDRVELYPDDWAHIYRIFPNNIVADYQPETDSSGLAQQHVIPFPERYRPKFAHHKNYTALFPEMEPRRNVYEIDPTANNILYTLAGNAVLIPSNSLERADGKLPEGKIWFSVREFQKPDELLAHGAPTVWDSARETWYLTQRYLTELSATWDNQPLQLKAGNFIKIHARTNSDSSDRFYALDEKTGRWKHYYDYDYDFDDAQIRVIDFYSWFKDSSARRHYAADRSNLAARFLSGDHYHTLPYGTNEAWILPERGDFVAYTEEKPASGVLALNLKRGKSLVAVQKAYVDRNLEKGVVKFNLLDRTEGKLFPELKAFKGYTFNYTGGLNSKAFSQQYIFHRKFFDIRVELEGGSPVVVLKCEEGFVRIPADLNYHPKGNSDKARKDFQNRYARYRRLLLAKQKTFDQHRESEYRARIAEYEARRTAIGKPTHTEIEMRVRSLGVFTWGHPEMRNDSMHLLVKFTDGGGLPVDVKQAFLLLKNPFTVCVYPKSETFDIRYRPDRFVSMGCQDYNGNVYVINHDRIGMLELKSNSLVYLPANLVARPVRNRKEFLKILGIQERK
jgi:hypothetical protein